MPKNISEIFAKLKNGTDYILNSDYDALWIGPNASPLNDYNEYIESINVPGRNIQTNDVKTANSLNQKIANDMTYEDMEVVWRLPKQLSVLKLITGWMDTVKRADANGFITTGYFEEYCIPNSCQISITTGSGNVGGFENTKICQITGLYPTAYQSIQFSADGGEHIKLNTTFACYQVLII